MPLPTPTFLAAHGVLGLANPAQRDPARDEAFIVAVHGEFPNIINRALLPVEAPSQAPHLLLASSSSQLALSSAQADFEVRFYGDYLTDMRRALDYVERKLSAVLAGFEAGGTDVSLIGLIATLHFSFKDMEGGEGPAAHVLRTHLRTDVDPSEVQDALARVAVKLRDTYFVTLTLSNYESRVLERPIMLGMPLRVRPWEGRVDDFGLELVIDINNNLEARTTRHDPTVTGDGVRTVAGVLREIATRSGPDFVESGRVSAEALGLSTL